MVSGVALNFGVVLAVATLGVSVMLAFVSFVSYARLRSLKLLFPGAAFVVLAAKGAVGTWRGVVAREADLPTLVFDFLVLAFLYASVAAR